MAIARTTRRTGGREERVAAHIEELKKLIAKRFPGARFRVGPVPESSWPGLWVKCDAEYVDDVTEPLREERWRFFVRDKMDVHVIVE